jgi:hypothetical protein
VLSGNDEFLQAPKLQGFQISMHGRGLVRKKQPIKIMSGEAVAVGLAPYGWLL